VRVLHAVDGRRHPSAKSPQSYRAFSFFIGCGIVALW
jgi:hypothetical protein